MVVRLAESRGCNILFCSRSTDLENLNLFSVLPALSFRNAFSFVGWVEVETEHLRNLWVAIPGKQDGGKTTVEYNFQSVMNQVSRVMHNILINSTESKFDFKSLPPR